MSEQTAVVESSATPVMEVERGPLVNLTGDQRAEFRKTGNLPEPPKREEAAPSSEAQAAETSPAPEAENKQQEKKPAEKPKPTAEDRIAQLEATIEKIRKGAGIEKTQKAESSPAKVEQPIQQPQFTRPKPTADDKNKDGSPKFQTYEDFVEDLADWKAEQRWAAQQREQAQQAQARELNAKVAEARSRYENFDEILQPTIDAIVGDTDVAGVVKQMLNDSDILPDLIFTIGSSKEELASFVKMAKENPGKALRYIALTESLINEELEGKAKPKGGDKPKETPAKPQTAAPKPPSEVGGRAASLGDALESAAKAGDFRNFKAEANRRYLAKLKG